MKPAFVRNAKLIVIVCASIVGFAGCDSFTAPVDIDVRTDKMGFPLTGSFGGRSAMVTGTVFNDETRSVWLGYCGSAIQKQAGKQWVDVWLQDCSGVNGVLREIRPQESATFRVDVIESFASSLGPPFSFDPCSSHRVVVALYDKDEVTSTTERIISPSNSFSFVGDCI